MSRYLSLIALMILSACGSGDRSRVVLPPEGLALDSTGSVQRIYLPDSLVLIAQLGGSERDTALLDPYVLEAWGDRAYIVEGEQRIQAYDTLANLVWKTGRDGSGPGEFRNIRDIKIAPNREIWVSDPVNARITRIDSDGAVIGTVSLAQVGHSETMVPVAGLMATLLPPYADADILTVDTAGIVVDRDTVRWAGFHELEHLSRQFETANDPMTGRWVMGFSFGNGWFAFEGHGGSERRYYVEPTRFPPVVKEVSNGGSTISSKLVRGDQSGAAIAMVADTVFVLFGGADKPRQKIDLYSWTSGKYLGTIALPESADDFAVTGSHLYTLASYPVPKFTVYRR